MNASYDAGFSDLDMLFLIDRSESMSDGNKWTSATAALTSFVNDPAEKGLGVSLGFFPPVAGDSCSSDNYAHPTVPMVFLPNGATKMVSTLAAATPDYGETPLAEALRGGVEYARGVRFADPTRDVAIAVITDGAPQGCDTPASDDAVHAVEAVAAEALADEPSIRTFIIGLSIGYVDPMNAMAAAGGTKQAILIDASPNTAQNIVDALGDVRDTIAKCRFAVPPVGDANVTAEDLSISYRLSPDDAAVPLSLYSSPSACGSGNGFVVDNADAPTRVQLCPTTCSAVHAHTTSKITVTAGCGAGAPDGGARGDGGECSNQTNVSCVSSCSPPKTFVQPMCSFGEWTCPSGSHDVTQCDCPAIPHGCCLGDGTYADASCVNAQWTCPAGATIFGSSTCSPPAVCASLLPCGPGTYCKFPDISCGTTNVLGTCVSEPTSCTPSNAPVCGCDSILHPGPCDAASQAIDVTDSSSCTTPAGTFNCGPYFCRENDQICKKTVDLTKKVGGTTWACIADTGCPTGCKCNQCEPCPPGHSKCNELCTGDASSGRFLTCSELP